MLPSYNYTEITSCSGNTKIYIFKKKKSRKISEYHKQKILGITLILIGITGMTIFPEDCGGFLIAVLLGITRTIC